MEVEPPHSDNLTCPPCQHLNKHACLRSKFSRVLQHNSALCGVSVLPGEVIPDCSKMEPVWLAMAFVDVLVQSL
eukprot:18310-Amphidinium_carterae.1